MQTNARESQRQRFDQYVMDAYRDLAVVTQKRQEILANWDTDPVIKDLRLSKIPYAGQTTPAENEAAIRSITDYFFERIIVPTMSNEQVDAYCLDLAKTCKPEQLADPENGAPVFIESMHHFCCFSGIYLYVRFLVRSGDWDNVIMLHQRDNVDPRMIKCAAALNDMKPFELVTISFKGNWYKKLRAALNQRSIVVYMGDLPVRQFVDQHVAGQTSSRLTLARAKGPALALEGFTFGPKLASKLGAQHFLIDYPEDRTVRVRPAASAVSLSCALSAWIFWPGLWMYLSGSSH